MKDEGSFTGRMLPLSFVCLVNTTVIVFKYTLADPKTGSTNADKCFLALLALQKHTVGLGIN